MCPAPDHLEKGNWISELLYNPSSVPFVFLVMGGWCEFGGVELVGVRIHNVKMDMVGVGGGYHHRLCCWTGASLWTESSRTVTMPSNDLDFLLCKMNTRIAYVFLWRSNRECIENSEDAAVLMLHTSLPVITLWCSLHRELEATLWEPLPCCQWSIVCMLWAAVPVGWSSLRVAALASLYTDALVSLIYPK